MVSFKEYAQHILSRKNKDLTPEEREYRRALSKQVKKQIREKAERQAAITLGTSLTPYGTAKQTYLSKKEKQDVERQVALEYGTPKQKLAIYEQQYKGKLYKRQAAQIERFNKYDNSRSGKVAKGFMSALGFLQSPTRALYKNTRVQTQPRFRYPQERSGEQRVSMNRRTTVGVMQGRVGRPPRTYDKRYAAYGCVYGYRKFMSAQFRQQRMQQMQDSQLTPEQQQVLDMMKQRAYAQQANPENQVIPNTTGKINMRGFMDEIDDAVNLVD